MILKKAIEVNKKLTTLDELNDKMDLFICQLEKANTYIEQFYKSNFAERFSYPQIESVNIKTELKDSLTEIIPANSLNYDFNLCGVTVSNLAEDINFVIEIYTDIKIAEVEIKTNGYYKFLTKPIKKPSSIKIKTVGLNIPCDIKLHGFYNN